MRTTSTSLALLVAAALVAAPLHAESYSLTLDPASTKITFVLDAFLHKVRGSAALVRGEIRFDDVGTASGEVVVDATTAQTGSEGRDKDMHTKVLESAKWKEIVLAIDGYEGELDPASPSNITVKGRFRIHGSEHPVEIAMDLKPQTDGAERRLAAGGVFTVPYVEWGMKDPSKAFLRVGKSVEVSIDAIGVLSAGATSPATN
jgi:polyisoprenoid-binding protein YceI